MRGISILTLPMTILMLTSIDASARDYHRNLFTLDSYGAITDPGASGCQFTPEGCTVVESGAFESSEGSGRWSATIHIDWASAVSNNQGGFCAPATGTGEAIFGTGLGNSLSFSSEATVCEIGATGTGVPHFLSGRFLFTGGIGNFLRAEGHGAISGADSGTGPVRLSMRGFLSKGPIQD